MAKHGISGYTHTQQQINNYANQCNPNNSAYRANNNNHSNQCNPNSSAYRASNNNHSNQCNPNNSNYKGNK